MSKEKKTASRHPALDALMDEITPLDSLKTDDRMNTAIRIFDLVKEKGWSKKVFADKMHKEPSVISRWFSGTHNFTLDTLTEIRDVLGVTLDELVREKTPDLVFKTQFLAGVADVKRYYGGGPAIHISGQASESLINLASNPFYQSLDRKDHVIDLSATMGMATTILRGNTDLWNNIGKCMWVGKMPAQGSLSMKPVKKHDDQNESNAVLKV